MALTKCKECGKEISNKAEACPHCGAKPYKASGCLVVFLVGAAIFGTIGVMSSKDSPPPITPEMVAPKPAPKPPGSQWYYHRNDDPMGKGTVHQAHVSSSNTVNFGFPYSGMQHATLALRTHPRQGKDVIFRIEKGQVLCHSYQDCTVLVRFDDEPPTNYSGVGAADNSTETVFIRNYDRFIGKMLKAKRVRIAVNIYQEGAPVFEFDVSNFDQGRYKSTK